MPKLEWDKIGERLYETGVDRGVFYSINSEGKYVNGEAWNGLTNVNETPSGAESNKQYADNIAYLNLLSAEEFAATIEAFTYPDGFAAADGSAELATGVTIGQQTRKPFGLCYRTLIGNDVDGQDHGYKLHLVYGLLASPSERSYGTVNDSPEAATMSWEANSTPVNVTGFKPTSVVTVDSTKTAAAKLAALEAILYGSETDDARMPLPDEVKTIVGEISG